MISLNCNANGFYNVIDASALVFSEKRSAFSGNVKLGLNIDLSKNTMLQVNVNMHSSELTPQGRELAGSFTNAGLRKDIFKGKASLVITASDIFNTQQWASVIDTPELYQKVVNKRTSRSVYIGFSWRFGGMKKTNDLDFDNKM
jgi:hypothetical protein